VEVTASGAVEGRPNAVLEQIVGRLSLEPAVTAARWRIEQLAEQASEKDVI
jgi:putative Mg2+ transporter-C (MgtC) family protein